MTRGGGELCFRRRGSLFQCAAVSWGGRSISGAGSTTVQAKSQRRAAARRRSNVSPFQRCATDRLEPRRMCASAPAGFNTPALWGSAFDIGTAMAFAPDGRLFVCRQNGELRVIQNGQLLATPFTTFTTTSTGERGLLGIAF